MISIQGHHGRLATESEVDYIPVEEGSFLKLTHYPPPAWFALHRHPAYGFPVDVTLAIPDDLTARLGGPDGVSRRALEAFAAEEYRAGRLTPPELCRLLGFSTGPELDRFLRERHLAETTTSASGECEQPPTAAGDLVARFRAFRTGKTLGGLDPAELIREGRR